MKNETYGPHQCSIIETDANIIALLAYFSSIIAILIPIISLVAFFAPLLIYGFEKNSTFVKFHAMQSFLLNAASTVIIIICAIIVGACFIYIASINPYVNMSPLALMIVVIVVTRAVIFILRIVAAVNAYKYHEYHLPIIGSWAARISGTN